MLLINEILSRETRFIKTKRMNRVLYSWKQACLYTIHTQRHYSLYPPLLATNTETSYYQNVQL